MSDSSSPMAIVLANLLAFAYIVATRGPSAHTNVCAKYSACICRKIGPQLRPAAVVKYQSEEAHRT